VIYIATLLVFIGLYNDVLAYPNNYASYHVSVRQYRILPFGFLQCMGRPKPPCHLLILLGVTPAYKGFTPSGKIHTCCLLLLKFICIFRLFQELTTSVRAAHAGRTHRI
jgi:hypothetical protein